MARDSAQIIACPPALVESALAVVLSELAPTERQALALTAPGESLVVALRDGALVDAAWGQPQPGSTAVLWPPQQLETSGPVVVQRLIAAAARALDAFGIRMTQALLPSPAAPIIPALEAAGFAHLVDLEYLSWEAAPVLPPTTLQFEPFQESQAERLAPLVEATYAETMDCPAMNGMRPMCDVLAGYRGTGRYRPENWQFARAGDEDVGVLLLAEHAAAKYWELMYMGLVPSVRGRSWGGEIVRQAQRMALDAGAQRLLLAVDAANAPALAMYRQAGFAPWDRRTVYVRFSAKASDLRSLENLPRA